MCFSDYIDELSLRDSGVDIEYDPQFLTLVQAIEGGEEVQYGEKTYKPEEMNWLWGAEQCEQLLKRSLDLRVATYQSYAWLLCDGISGFITGLQMIHYLISERWNDVHPQLLAEDGYDPLIRLNALAYLTAHDTVQETLKKSSLIVNNTGETLSFLSLENTLQAGDESHIRKEVIENFLLMCDTEAINRFYSTVDSLQYLLGVIRNINTSLSERVGISAGHQLEPLEKLVQSMFLTLQPHVQSVSEIAGEENFQISTLPAKEACKPEGECFNRQDAKQALDAVCRYYRNFEPNSPVPLLIERAKKMIEMDFIQIIHELTPESMGNIQNLAGLTNTDE